jgi:hypothetical protein
VAGGGRRERDVVELALPVAVTFGLALLWAGQFHPFVFPNNDFYSFERAAESLAAGELPRSLKRGPILPALMAALAPALPGRHPHLLAALVSNLVFSAATVLLLHRFAARTFPAAAPLFLLLLAATPVLHAAALQPLVEPSLALFVALAFALFRACSPWQYAAAAAAALSRPEAAALVAVLCAANVAAERRALPHVALAALGALPFVAWSALGALRGAGAETYLALREGYGGAAAPLFLAVLAKEGFFGWWGRSPAELFALALAVAAPVAIGARRAWREAPREAGAMLAWLALSAAAIVAFGVAKARYVHAVLWVALLCFALGAVEIARRAGRALGEHSGSAAGGRGPLRGALAARAPVVLAGALALVLASRGALRLAREEHVAGAAPELAFAALLLALLAAAAWRIGGAAPRARAAAALVAFALAAPVALGGLERKAQLLRAVHDFDYAAWPAARWLGEHLAPGERVALLHTSQVLFATGLAPGQVVSFGRFEAETLPALLEELRRRGVTHVAYIHRRPARTDAERFYARRKRVDLAELFASGRELPGLEHLATLSAPARLRQPPAQIYRVR